MREKRAALIIERFFITIKAEIDREVKQMEERKQKKRNRRNLMCETDFISHRAAVKLDNRNATSHRSEQYVASSTVNTHLSNDTPQSSMTHHMGYQSYGFTEYTPASAYMNQDHGLKNYSHASAKIQMTSEESFELELSQTRSETEARLQRLQDEVAGLVNRYQAAEDELQSVGHSIGTSSAVTDPKKKFSHQLAGEEAQTTVLGEKSNTYRQESSVTPPRMPLQHRLYQLHDITPPRVSNQQHQRYPLYENHRLPPQHHLPQSLQMPMPFRYTYSSPHTRQSAGIYENTISPHIYPPQSQHVYYSEHRTALPHVGSQQTLHFTNNLSSASSDSNGSPQNYAPPSNFKPLVQGQTTPNRIQGSTNYYNPRQIYTHQNQQNLTPNQHHQYFMGGVPRTPSGRQF
jgi:hypothetical protein